MVETNPALAGECDDGIDDPAVAAVFDAYTTRLKSRLMRLRGLILEAASTTQGVGKLEETLKWGQPSYLTTETKAGSTIRIDKIKSGDRQYAQQYAMYFHCQTTLVATFRELYPDELSFEGNRAIIFSEDEALPEDALRHCIALALFPSNLG